MHRQFHIHFSPPHGGWHQGSFAVYEITGDEIAKRIEFDTAGAVHRRDPWPGYIGTVGDIEHATKLIQERMAK